ncbi:hypothetical protein N6H05_20900 [Sphingobium sp. WTD-1]|uniref:hypothetical protein n=1 Tax=Sphingobium sp. WTD-1 TaxID=2979467 RepID=UPI0024DDFA84|nr:hypothetical protein [Sphingobium sp. WTD-1]WIA55461.1 hypothetical protein N6H05_20900 [Sphingobium sp. WTD-1]
MEQHVLTVDDWWAMVSREQATADAMVNHRAHCDAAWNASGRAVEFALKAVIMKRERWNCWPDRTLAEKYHTHDIRMLFRLAGIDVRTTPPPPRHLLRTVMDWKREHDYRPGRMTRQVARSMVKAAFSEEGVVQWLKNQ